MHKYTVAERKFLEEYAPGHKSQEITTAFNKNFKSELTQSQIQSYMSRNKIRNGINCCFKKGHIPFNKGKKGICAKGCEKTWFKKGNIPSNHREVGSERFTKDGFVEIKVSEPNHWELKHRWIWEKEKGKIPPKHNIIFLDGNRENCNIENLDIVSNQENLILNQNNLRNNIPELMPTCVNIARLQKIIKVKQKEV